MAEAFRQIFGEIIQRGREPPHEEDSDDRLLPPRWPALAGPVAQAAEAMRCSHQLPPQHHIAQVIDRWAAEVEAQSNGDIDVQVFGANSLSGAKENIPGVAKGSIECAFSVNFQWGKTLPIMNVTLKPYAITSKDVLELAGIRGRQISG